MELAVLVRTCKHSEIDITSREDSLPNKFGYALKCDNISISYSKTPIQVPIPQQSPELIDIGVYRPSVSTSGVIDTVGETPLTASQTTTLTSGIDGVTLTIPVASIGSSPAMALRDVINVTGAEDMEITAMSSTTPDSASTLTVIRAVNGTTAYSHSSGASVKGYGPAFFEGMPLFDYTRTYGYGAAAAAKPYYIPYKNKLEDFTTNLVYSPETPLELEWGDANFAKGTQQTGGAIYLVALQQARFQVDASKEDRYTFSLQFVVSARRDK